jgi:hypothetical protein
MRPYFLSGSGKNRPPGRELVAHTASFVRADCEHCASALVSEVRHTQLEKSRYAFKTTADFFTGALELSCCALATR